VLFRSPAREAPRHRDPPVAALYLQQQRAVLRDLLSQRRYAAARQICNQQRGFTDDIEFAQQCRIAYCPGDRPGSADAILASSVDPDSSTDNLCANISSWSFVGH
jgi:hypothetical protein